ncbi:hypothetical protein AQ490_15030 [Wenjunlia vitaminophila]|uniref:SHOCT domain-containing protein n=2 Tax=Wenjunlia vitaminophila TaxID=76728 RepID=A0A0T6LX93_WENVI|nr:hypothetical protein AQ490_15030 [Wenjunlia vitaminophila]
MFWYSHDMNGWGWFAMLISMVVFWALIITVGVLIYRASTRSAPSGTGPTGWHRTSPPGSPEQVLADRYARGEIDDEEYHRRLNTLRGSSPGTPPSS